MHHGSQGRYAMVRAAHARTPKSYLHARTHACAVGRMLPAYRHAVRIADGDVAGVMPHLLVRGTARVLPRTHARTHAC
jgi:hypothetical protein